MIAYFGLSMHARYAVRQRHGRLKSRPELETVNKKLECWLSPTCSPSGARKRECAFLTYLQTGYATAT